MRNLFRPSKRLFAAFFLAAAVFAASPASAQKPGVDAIDPKAQDVLKQSAATYAALKSYSCQAVTELKIDSLPGSRIIALTLAFQKPDHAAVSVTKYGETQQFFSDGKSLYLYDPDKKQYLQEALPPNVPAAAPVLTQGESFIGLLLMKPDGLLTNDGNIKSLTLGGREMLDGESVQTVTKVMQAKSGGTLTFLVTLGMKDHLIYRFASVLLSPKPLPVGDGKAKRIDNTETYTDIRANPALPAASFLPPAAAKKITDKKITDTEK